MSESNERSLHHQQPAAESQPNPAPPAEVLAGAAGLVQQGFQAHQAAISRPMAAPAPVQAADADITPEMKNVTPTFGEFVKGVGLGVAATQQALDQTLRDTAKSLSDTQIEVIAVFQQVMDDDGTITDGVPLTQKLPLINYLMPTAYQFSRVFLEADMNVAEFNAASGFNIQGSSTSVNAKASAGFGIGGFGASGSASFGSNSFQTSVNSSSSQDIAVGKMHLEATLEPRSDIELPKPVIVQKGPQLRLSVTSVQDQTTAVPATGSTPATTKVTGRQAVLTAELLGGPAGSNPGKPLSGKSLEVSFDKPFQFTTSGATDQNGHMTITVTRDGASFDPSIAAAVTGRVWLGLVSQTIVFNL